MDGEINGINLITFLMHLFITVVCIYGIFVSFNYPTTYQEAISNKMETTDIQEENEKTTQDDYANGYFTVIAEWYDSFVTYRIVYANDTKVKYFISSFDYCFLYTNKTITPLYNTDGTLQIYEE